MTESNVMLIGLAVVFIGMVFLVEYKGTAIIAGLFIAGAGGGALEGAIAYLINDRLGMVISLVGVYLLYTVISKNKKANGGAVHE